MAQQPLDPWGTAGMYTYGGRTGDAEGGYETQWDGNQTVERNGQTYLRIGESTRYDSKANPGEIIYDPVEGKLVAQSLVQRVDPGTIWDPSSMLPVMLAAGGLGAFLGPAMAAGVGAAGLGGEGAALGAGLGAGEGAALGGTGAFDLGGLAGGVEGAGGATGWTAGGGFPTAGGGGAVSGGFDLFDPSTWFNSPPTTGASDLVDAVGGEGGEEAIDFGDFFNDQLTDVDVNPNNIGDIVDLTNDPALNAAGGNWWDSLFSGGGMGGLGGWGNLLGGLVGGLGSYFGSQAQADSAEQANMLQWLMYQQNRADLAPWREAGVGALGNLTHLTTPGEKVTAMEMDPGYGFRLQQGMRGVDNKLSGMGMANSGRALKEAMRYNQGFASNEFGNVFNRNASLAGLGQTANLAGVNNATSTGQNIGNNYMAAGDAIGSGYAGMANAFNQGLAGYANANNPYAPNWWGY